MSKPSLIPKALAARPVIAHPQESLGQVASTRAPILDGRLPDELE